MGWQGFVAWLVGLLLCGFACNAESSLKTIPQSSLSQDKFVFDIIPSATQIGDSQAPLPLQDIFMDQVSQTGVVMQTADQLSQTGMVAPMAHAPQAGIVSPLAQSESAVAWLAQAVMPAGQASRGAPAAQGGPGGQVSPVSWLPFQVPEIELVAPTALASPGYQPSGAESSVSRDLSSLAAQQANAPINWFDQVNVAIPAAPASGVVPAVPAAQTYPAAPASGVVPAVPAAQTYPAAPASGVVPAVPAAQTYPAAPASGVVPAVPAAQGGTSVTWLTQAGPARELPSVSQIDSDGLGAQSFPIAQAPGTLPTLGLGQTASEVKAPPKAQDTPVAQTPQRAQIQSVRADCRENSVLVLVKRDLLGIGSLIQPSEVKLGGCGASGQENAAQVLLFETPLQGCGSVLVMTSESLIYRFQLVYAPHHIGSTPIVRTNGAVVNVECHYLRKHNVSSKALKPTWIPYSASKAAENILVFTLKLMTEDWTNERASNVYFVGDLINVEASVIVSHHVPLRVFVDSCVAALTPDVKQVPRYAFIEKHGCLVDAKLTSSRSQFMPRTRDDKLKFQLDAFRFSGDARGIIYFSCLLKATPASYTTDAKHKACSFVSNAKRWVAASGNDQVCSCCDASCASRKGRSLSSRVSQWRRVTLGPLFVHESPLDTKHPA
uniref:Zona pellucida sperm-binding protein 3 n=1 Tax=Pantodon buchholzi TaxID=8276 RepID=A0A7R6VNI6_PANBU|nr:egg envelope protein [Pantodon buchholzi]